MVLAAVFGAAALGAWQTGSGRLLQDVVWSVDVIWTVNDGGGTGETP